MLKENNSPYKWHCILYAIDSVDETARRRFQRQTANYAWLKAGLRFIFPVQILIFNMNFNESLILVDILLTASDLEVIILLF